MIWFLYPSPPPPPPPLQVNNLSLSINNAVSSICPINPAIVHQTNETGHRWDSAGAHTPTTAPSSPSQPFTPSAVWLQRKRMKFWQTLTIRQLESPQLSLSRDHWRDQAETVQSPFLGKECVVSTRTTNRCNHRTLAGGSVCQNQVNVLARLKLKSS